MIRTSRGPGPRARSMNTLLAAMLRRGIALPHLYLLETRGRRTGAAHTVPVLVLSRAGGRYLVAPRGATDWALNLRHDGRGVLLRGRRRTPVQAHALSTDHQVTAVLAYLDAFGWLTRELFGLPRGYSAQRAAETAPHHPAFRLDDDPT